MDLGGGHDSACNRIDRVAATMEGAASGNLYRGEGQQPEPGHGSQLREVVSPWSLPGCLPGPGLRRGWLLSKRPWGENRTLEAGRLCLCELIIPVVSGVNEQSEGPRPGPCPSLALSGPGSPSFRQL